MNRREFLQTSLGVSVTGAVFGDVLAGQGAGPVQIPPPVPIARRLVLDASSESLQWLRSADEVAEAAIEMACGGVSPTVAPFPGHINPARVAQELPAFVNRTRSHGLRVTQIKGPAITDVSEPNAEAIIAAAAQAGCTHYSLGGYTYDLARPLAPQLDAIKGRIDRFVRLSQKHRMTLVYDTVPGPASVGGVVLDLLSVLKEFDPTLVGFHWDTGHMALHGDGMWETLMRLAGPYVAAVGWRDRQWVQDLGLLGEGGPYAGPYPRVEPLVTLPDGTAVPGPAAALGLVPPESGDGRGSGRSGRGGRGRGGAGDGEDGEVPVAPPARGRGTGPARGPANPAGAGSIDDSNPLYRSVNGEMPKRPIGGKNVKGGGWIAEDAAMGTGIVHIPRVATVLAAIGFNGPTDLQSHYAGIGGAERGAATITRPRQWVLGMLKRDVITIRKSFEMANCGLAI
jgi:sugar phosphate isomerase/epimerase